VTDDVRIADLLAHALATTRPVGQVVLPRHLVDHLHREMGELTRRAEKAEAELTENTGVLQALRRQRDTAEQQVRRVRALHRPDMSGHCCEGCWDYDGSPELYPCPTIRALDEETPA